ncbi:cytochrome P450 [Amycolatopsis jejuensis]|uniref:cytochrome P450 n=1 Tax=Amycolatopsis jejuensis TaxID=330084 RepID=UPI0005256EA8|nr:cytochrome P450 [Amycolatopsis jejuensis]
MTETARRGKEEICGYHAVRAAARDHRTYSSDFLGDTDVRTYRHLPLEADPPRHTDLRMAIQPLVSDEQVGAKRPNFRAVATGLLADAVAKGSIEVGRDLAFPFVQGCLAELFGRQQDLDEWISWGPSVWMAGAYLAGDPLWESTKEAERNRDYTMHTQRSPRVMDDYLHRVLDEADRRQGAEAEPRDAWDFLAALRIDGRRLPRHDLMGIAGVLLAGGRDTVMKLITGLVWHLVNSPEDRAYLTENPDARAAAVTELARYLSPLPRMERSRTTDGKIPPPELDGAHRVLLSFVSANFDDEVWDEPERIDIRRAPKANLAFGFGRHSCLGTKITEHESQVFLDVLLGAWPGWEFAEEPVLIWDEITTGAGRPVRVLDEFESVRLTTRSAQ